MVTVPILYGININYVELILAAMPFMDFMKHMPLRVFYPFFTHDQNNYADCQLLPQLASWERVPGHTICYSYITLFNHD